MRRALPLLLAVLLAGTARADERTERAKTYFRQNCMSCHTIGGGRLTGPDLKDVEGRKDRAWIKRFLLDPPAVISSGDAYALKLQQEARGALMPKPAGIDPKMADALLDLIAAESKLEKSEFVGLQLSERPLTAEDAEQGRKIFLGLRKLEHGGPACISCHAVAGIGGLGGGRLGPDLTKVHERLEGRKGLATWLTAPATPTMQSVFKPRKMESEEILYLVAYLQQAAGESSEVESSPPFNFIVLGLLGAIGVLAVFDVLWRKRFRAVRSPMVHNGRKNHR